jgi:hypothetical protein
MENEIIEVPIKSTEVTIDEIIYLIRDIMKEYVSSSEKVGKIKNLVDSIEVVGDVSVVKGKVKGLV